MYFSCIRKSSPFRVKILLPWCLWHHLIWILPLIRWPLFLPRFLFLFHMEVLWGSIFWPLSVLLHTFSLCEPCVLAPEWSHDPGGPIKVFPGNFVRIIRKMSSLFLETIGVKGHISLELPGTFFSSSRGAAWAESHNTGQQSGKTYCHHVATAYLKIKLTLDSKVLWINIFFFKQVWVMFLTPATKNPEKYTLCCLPIFSVIFTTTALSLLAGGMTKDIQLAVPLPCLRSFDGSPEPTQGSQTQGPWGNRQMM